MPNALNILHHFSKVNVDVVVHISHSFISLKSTNDKTHCCYRPSKIQSKSNSGIRSSNMKGMVLTSLYVVCNCIIEIADENGWKSRSARALYQILETPIIYSQFSTVYLIFYLFLYYFLILYSNSIFSFSFMHKVYYATACHSTADTLSGEVQEIWH